MSDNNHLEKELSEMLTEGKLSSSSEEERREEERRRLSPKYEIRIQTNLDPIVRKSILIGVWPKKLTTVMMNI